MTMLKQEESLRKLKESNSGLSEELVKQIRDRQNIAAPKNLSIEEHWRLELHVIRGKVVHGDRLY